MMPNEVFELMLTPAQLAVLSYLVKCSDDDGMSFPSVHTIALACGISDNTVRKAVRYLESRGIIKKRGGFAVSKFGKVKSTSCMYYINPDFYCEGFARRNLVRLFSENKDGI